MLKSFITGCKRGIDYWYIVLFNKKIPRGICWLIGIVTIPINILILIIILICGVKRLISIADNIENEINEKLKEEA